MVRLEMQAATNHHRCETLEGLESDQGRLNPFIAHHNNKAH